MRRIILTLSVLVLVGSPLAAQAQRYSPQELNRRTIERRAVEAAIWGMPLVNFDAMRQAYFRDADANYGDVLYFSRPADWKFQTTTPNNSTRYVMFFTNLKDGPVVVDIPAADHAALFGTLIESWQVPLMDVGNAGEDKGKGGQYLLLPPGYSATVPDGYIAVRSATMNMYGLLRVITKTNSAEDAAKAIGYLQKMRVYPLSAAASPPATRFIDIAGKTFDGIAAFDENFYASLARMVNEEPVIERDLTITGQFHTLGIGKDAKFQPDAATNAILHRAAAEAHDLMFENFKRDGFVWWTDRKWKFLGNMDVMKSKLTFVLGDRFLLDERASLFFGAYAPTAGAAPNLYVKTFEDGKGKLLDGSNTYRLRNPCECSDHPVLVACRV